MWKKKTVSVVFSTYNEKKSIRSSINEFFKTGYVDEIIVVNNNAAKGTDEEVKKTKAKLFHEEKQGYGFGYQRAMKEAKGDIIIMSEPDGTFVANDVLKLLAYSDDFDVVFGSRTMNSLIGQNANMGYFLKYGNFALAKLMEILFNTTQLTDVGCTMRVIKRKVYDDIKDKFTVGTSHFGPEMMMLVILNKTKFIEIPLNYRERIGKSSVTGSFWKAFKLGWVMIFLILRYRIKSWWGK